MPSAFLVAAPHSGAGKTTCTLAILAALRARGLTVQAYKVGPDYIDPAHHAQLTGRPSHNLDTWMLSPEANRFLYDSARSNADVAVVEGVMGLFDGVDGRRPLGSSADLARQLGLPVVLVVDARSMARSAAAMVHGYTTFEAELRTIGVIWNRVGSASHQRILDEALAGRDDLPPSLGAIPRDAAITVPERHLGLVTPDEEPTLKYASALAQIAETHIDLDRLLAQTRCAPAGPPPDTTVFPLRGLKIGVARDQAFCFYYEENLCCLQRAGAELIFFRPADGDGIPANLDGLYLGGGYPEVHAERLSANTAFMEGIRRLHRRGIPIYAECGGFMVLCEGLETSDGKHVPMAAIFPARCTMNQRAFRLGYREVELKDLKQLAGTKIRGHEFHYSQVTTMPDEISRSYRVWNARGENLAEEGYRSGNTLAGYIHLHFASNPHFPLHLFGRSPSSPPVDPTG